MNFLFIICALILIVTTLVFGVKSFMEGDYWDAGFCVIMVLYALLFLFENWKNETNR